MLQTWISTARAVWLSHWMDWAIFGLYLAVTWIAAALARRLMRSLLPIFTARTNTVLDDRLVKAAAAPVRLTVLALGLRISLQALAGRIAAFQKGGAYGVEFGWAELVTAALVILALTALANALLKAAMDWYIHELAARSQGTWDEELLPLFRRLLSMLLYFIAASIIFDRFGYPITALVTTAGVASLAVALAAQETLSNMLGGLVILVDRPFRVGDVIELTDGKAGEVVEIGLRSTRIKQFDGNALVVPNKDMASTRVINYALPNHRAAIRQTITVDYRTDVEQAKALLLQAMKSHPEILSDPEPGVWFTKFGEHGLDIFMSCWVVSYKERFRIADELNVRILAALRGAGVSVPFPQRDVHIFFEGSAEEKRGDLGKHTSGRTEP
ncbi:MAG TPA: mechanosensitive ion channel family protein [Symbiobacteriaceae bacterium]|nr:mechanosensitive ion channel family protein [Symbiobacteriaceae bacterium]